MEISRSRWSKYTSTHLHEHSYTAWGDNSKLNYAAASHVLLQQVEPTGQLTVRWASQAAPKMPLQACHCSGLYTSPAKSARPVGPCTTANTKGRSNLSSISSLRKFQSSVQTCSVSGSLGVAPHGGVGQ